MAAITNLSMETSFKPKDTRNSRANDRAGEIFVVEETVRLQQAREREGELKHGKELFKPSIKPIFQLLLWDIGFLLSVLIACVLWSIPLLIIPVTNTVIFPSYWWEFLVNGIAVANSL